MKKKILIVEDNLNYAKELYKYLKENNDFIEILGIANNGEEALKYVNKFKLDFILLDLEMPKLNGLKFLEKIQNNEINVLISSAEYNLINRINYEYFKFIKKIYIKPYQISKLNVDLIKMSNDFNNSNIKEKIEIELSNFNFNRGSCGYNYLIKCIEKSIEEPIMLKNMEKDLFPYVSRKLKIDNWKEIKWSLQKLMNSMVRYTDNNIILQYFPYTKHPTLKNFITTINEIVVKKI